MVELVSITSIYTYLTHKQCPISHTSVNILKCSTLFGLVHEFRLGEYAILHSPQVKTFWVFFNFFVFYFFFNSKL